VGYHLQSSSVSFGRVHAYLTGEPSASLAGVGTMIDIRAQMRVLVAIELLEGRKGLDSLVRVCRDGSLKTR
jgi:hypothetical protein